MHETTSQPVALTIAGFDPSGGAGVIADVRTFAAFGCFPTAAITSLTFQNTTGVFGAVNQSAETVYRQVRSIIDDFNVVCVKTGMLPDSTVIDEVARLCSENALPAPVVDPVVCSTSGYALIDEKALNSIINRLVPYARVVTPNIPEAELMTGLKIGDEEGMVQAAERLIRLGCRAVLLKGGHLGWKNNGQAKEAEPGGDTGVGPDGPEEVADLLLIDRQLKWFRGPRVRSSSTHGTGCALSAGIAAGLGLGLELEAAVDLARKYVVEAIRNAPALGHGHGPLNFNVRAS